MTTGAVVMTVGRVIVEEFGKAVALFEATVGDAAAVIALPLSQPTSVKIDTNPSAAQYFTPC